MVDARSVVRRSLRLADGTYAGARARERVVQHLTRRGRPRPVLVYQMGKVASQGVSASLEAVGVHTHQIHFATAAGLAAAEAVYRRRWDATRGGAAHVWRGQWVRRQMDADPSARWQVLTLVRDPVARNLSSFFQIADLKLQVDVRNHRDEDGLRRLRQEFLETFDEHDVPATWFDRELRAVTGVDLLDEPFDPARGWQLVHGDRADVLVIRFEDLRRCFSQAVEALLGVPDVELVSTNVSGSKDYGPNYRAVQDAITLPDWYLDQQYGSRYARHFYSQDELTAMRARWRLDEADADLHQPPLA